MIESILKIIFPRENGFTVNAINLSIERKNTPFAIGDKKACRECHALSSRSNRVGCNEEVLRVDNNGAEIAVVNLEEYLAQFDKGSRGKCCDYLLTDCGMGHEKVVFCELCCYAELYVEKKKAKARQQMERGLETLIKEPQTAVLFLTYPQKIHLFAWRDYNIPDKPIVPERRNERANMQVFENIASNMASYTTSHHSIMNHEFTLVQIKYPSVYVW